MARVLIVDDEPRIRDLIREHLQYAGFMGHKSHLALVTFFLEMLLLPQIPCIAKTSMRFVSLSCI